MNSNITTTSQPATKRKSGALPGNKNAIRHGLRSGALPRGCGYVKRECDWMRREIEAVLVERNGGSISLIEAAWIQSAMRWERHALLAQRWLRKECESMDANERLAYSRDIAKASGERDRCLEKLKIDAVDRENVLEALYTRSDRPPDAQEAVSRRVSCDPDENLTEATSSDPKPAESGKS